MIKSITLVLILTLLISCNSAKSPITTTNKSSSKSVATSKNKRNSSSEVIRSTSNTSVTNEVISSYVYQYKDVAMYNMKTYGIPASIILAQGILESGAGRGELSLSANNHFGIKCTSDWNGESVRHDDDASQECFRKYSNSAESYKDHALFLKNRNRYSNLFDLDKDDYKAWARGLRAAGYATDLRYPEKLISYIERYDLAQFDAQVLGKKYNSSEKLSYTKGLFHEVQKGDTLYSISKKYNVQIEELLQRNNLSDNTLSIGQQIRIN